jgi:hypothetical protein
MFDEFHLSSDNVPVETKPNEPISAEEHQRFTKLTSRFLKPEDHRHPELLLLKRIKQRKPDLGKMFQTMSDHWCYEDHSTVSIMPVSKFAPFRTRRTFA